MGDSYGRKVLNPVVGRALRVSADGNPEWHPVGVTIDWSTVAAASEDITWKDGNVLKSGKKGLRYGQVLTMIRKAEVQTVDLSGDDDPTGGVWEMTILGETIEDIPWDVSAEALENLIQALNADGEVPGADQVTVTKSSFVYTITFPESLGNVAAITADASGLTGGGGDTFAITILTGTGGASGGKYGPYDSGASDGRQTLARDKVVILDTSILEEGSIPGLSHPAANHVGAIDGGRVWRARLLADDVTASLEDGPTLSALLAVMPRLSLVYDV